MSHYSNAGLTPKRVVCQYCGRPIKQGTSVNQGCGDICRQKHRNKRYRIIGFKEEVISVERFKKSE